jgi:PAS domain S-box-containing protein
MNLVSRHAFCLTGLLLFSFATKLPALDPLRVPSQYQYTEWNMTQGLPYSSVRGIYQTSDGFLWLATRAGLSRFDSVSFTNFTRAEMGGVTVDEVSFFAEDTRHRLWIGTKNGVVWYEQGHWSQPVLGPELERADITGLLSDGNGMYVATRNQVMRWEEGRLSVVNLGTEITLNSYFESLCRARNGDLLVVGNTVVRVKKDGGTEIFDRKRLIPNSSVIRAVAEDRSGGLWLATTVGLYLWKGNRLERLPKSNGFSINVVRSLCMDRDDNLWIGTQNGLLRYSQGKLANVYINGNESLSHILYIREDIEGNLWAGTDAGLMRLRDVKITNVTIRDGLPTNSIQTMLKARSGGVWVGTVGGGLVRMQQDGVRIFNQESGLTDNSPMALCEDDVGGLWISYFTNGVDYMRPDGSLEHHREVSSITSGLVELSPGDVWVSTLAKGGLYRLNNGTFKAINDLKDTGGIRALTRDTKGRLWAAWNRGVAIFENGKWARFYAPEDMGEKNPAVFYEHKDGSMWLLRDGFELQRFHEGNLQRLLLPEAAGRLSYGMVVRDGDVWINMRNGLLRAKLVDLESVWNGTKTKFDYVLFNESDGMRSPAPNNASQSSAVDMGPGGLWFATTKGIAVIQPEQIRIDKIPPNVVIDSILANGNDLVLAPVVRVPAGRGELAFRFTALSLGDPTRVLFKYRLEGFDPDWIDARLRREAHYGGLPPGAYRFRVIACNIDGVWNETGAFLDLFQEPLFYQTWWFYFGASLALVSGVIGLLRWRTFKFRLEAIRLTNGIAERTKELAKSLSVLHATFESTTDGILVVELSGKVVSYNNRFVNLWQIPPELLARGEAAGLLAVTSQQIKETGKSREWVEQTRGNPEGEAFCVMELKDGRTFEQSALPCWVEGRCVGRVFSVRDITGRKQAEAELARSHRQLLDASRMAGMAEVATGVLHNVGNVLNSVNVSATLVADHVRHSKGSSVAKVAELLHEHQADLAAFLTQDSRGRKIPVYLSTLAKVLGAEQKTAIAEIGLLQENVEHIKEIVAMQQSYGKVAGVTETVALADLVDDTLRMNASSLVRHNVELVRDFQIRPVISTDRHKIVQLLLNLMRNATFACNETGRADQRITVRIAGDASRVRISVIDNGVGIPAENLTRIFSHGFTTKQDGHGFGLHSGALAAKELGGSLSVQSDGPGHGATFTLELPCQPAPVRP